MFTSALFGVNSVVLYLCGSPLVVAVVVYGVRHLLQREDRAKARIWNARDSLFGLFTPQGDSYPHADQMTEFWESQPVPTDDQKLVWAFVGGYYRGNSFSDSPIKLIREFERANGKSLEAMTATPTWRPM